MPDPGKEAEKWRVHWFDQTLPGHDPESPELYEFHARELRLLFADTPLGSVLELGCGNGALYPYLGFDRLKYRGVDFSPSMLAKFGAKHPGADLVCHEASTYVDPESKYDLIFSNQLVQYFDRTMLTRHFECACAMIHQNSLFICAGVPWKVLRFRHRAGLLSRPRKVSFLWQLLASIYLAFAEDVIGHWHDLHEFAELADRHGFSANFYGSLVYPYRFHAVMRLR